jgi:8-oxo-(d)GTP phosphatase
MPSLSPIRAAGGVLASDGRLAVVHRPRYDDWSLPKGKLGPGEHPLVAACREVQEETGVRPTVGARLPSVSYQVRTPTGAQRKQVDYWSMTPAATIGFQAGPEIDDVAWLAPSDALARLTYPHDVAVLHAWSALPAVSATVLLVRPARARRRRDWRGPDLHRPLDPTGRAQARALGGLLGHYAPTRLAAAPPRRCQGTLAPLAAELNRTVDVDSALDAPAVPDLAAQRLRWYARLGGVSVLCSDGVLVPRILADLLGEPPARYRSPRATTWVLCFAGDAVVSIDRLRPSG